MNILASGKLSNMDNASFRKILGSYNRVEIDLGTGDATFIIKNAAVNKSNLYIGIEPAISQLKKAVRDINRKKLQNTLLVVASVETLPVELAECADIVNILFPWGTLLKSVLENIENITKLIKKGGTLRIIFGYDTNLEPSETKRLNLPEIDSDFVDKHLKLKIQEAGLKTTSIEKLTPAKVKDIESSWAKKLARTTARPVYLITAERTQ